MKKMTPSSSIKLVPSLTIVLPTKNRPTSLESALLSCLHQLHLVECLVVVDQSDKNYFPPDCELRRSLEECTNLQWIYDTSINGLVAAKNHGLLHVTTEIVCFLEDDVEIEPNYFQSILDIFTANPEILGLSGVVTNPPYGYFYAWLHRVFHTGIFYDSRPIFALKSLSNKRLLISSNKISGGISSWRSSVFKEVPLRSSLGFHLLEDIDYSMRVADKFGSCMALSSSIRLKHYLSPLGRPSLQKYYSQSLMEHSLFFNSRRTTFFDLLSLAWLMLGILLSALYSSIRLFSLSPLLGYIEGIIKIVLHSPNSCRSRH